MTLFPSINALSRHWETIELIQFKHEKKTVINNTYGKYIVSGKNITDGGSFSRRCLLVDSHIWSSTFAKNINGIWSVVSRSIFFIFLFFLQQFKQSASVGLLELDFNIAKILWIPVSKQFTNSNSNQRFPETICFRINTSVNHSVISNHDSAIGCLGIISLDLA